MLKISAFILTLVASSLNVVATRPNFKAVKRQGTVLAGSYISNITVAADDVVQCGNAIISWTGAVQPYTLMIGLGGQYIGTTELATFPNLYDNTFSWQVTQPSSSRTMIFQITDGSGAVGYVQNIAIESSDDYSCLASSASSSLSSASAPSSTSTTFSSISSSTSASSVSTRSSTTKTSSKATTTSPSNSVGSGSGVLGNQAGSVSSSTTPTPSSTSTSKSSTFASSSSSASVGLAAASSTKASSAMLTNDVHGSVGVILAGLGAAFGAVFVAL